MTSQLRNTYPGECRKWDAVPFFHLGSVWRPHPRRPCLKKLGFMPLCIAATLPKLKARKSSSLMSPSSTIHGVLAPTQVFVPRLSPQSRITPPYPHRITPMNHLPRHGVASNASSRISIAMSPRRKQQDAQKGRPARPGGAKPPERTPPVREEG